MGRPKQLLPLGDKPVIRHCIDNIIAAGIQEIVVVVSQDAQATAEALSGLPVHISVNKDIGSDMAGSVRVGLKAVDQSSSGVLVCLADHPLASGDTMKVLARTHGESPDKIIVPAHNGRRGHPSLFPMAVLHEIFVVDTLRDIVKKDEGRVRIVDVPDEGVVLDMDTPEDYEQVLKRAGGVVTDKT
jgi:molybdenum cofactor cytidylyltransferase